MFSRAVLRDLLHHMEWADAQVWAAIPADLPDDPRLRELLTHLHMVQQAFLAVWSQADVDQVFQQGKAATALADLRRWIRGYYAQAHARLDATTADHLNQLVAMPWAAQIEETIGRPPGPTTFAETVFQVTSHSTYHRGQVNSRLRELGLAPPNVDYIAWLWLGRPNPEWHV